jgi:uncharacterized protein (TIGR00730 family)
VLDEVQAHLPRISGAPTGELDTRALRKVGNSLARVHLQLGKDLAAAKLKLIYGGGGVGLMGACALAAHQAGGEVLGIIPHFLKIREQRLDVVETMVVDTMHERKIQLFDKSDAFVVLPGGIGTLEEIVELLSWRRLDLHAKPVVFYNIDGFWEPLFALFQHTVDMKLTPPEFMQSWASTDKIGDILPRLYAALPAHDSDPEIKQKT